MITRLAAAALFALVGTAQAAEGMFDRDRGELQACVLSANIPVTIPVAEQTAREWGFCEPQLMRIYHLCRYYGMTHTVCLRVLDQESVTALGY